MSRGYQHGFSITAKNANSLFLKKIRQRKANTMVQVISDCLNANLSTINVLNVGGSAGIIDEYLSRYFNHVTGMDIDKKAISHAISTFQKENLLFEIGDVMNMKYSSNSFDVIICSQVYEHVQDANLMMNEIYRVLKDNGIVYFAAGNRLVFNEPHYDLPLLSVIPRPLAHLYLKLLKKGDYYYEKHFFYWGLKNLVNKFTLIDYSSEILSQPKKYATEYMIEHGSRKQKIAIYIAKHITWLMPGYIWILKKNK